MVVAVRGASASHSLEAQDLYSFRPRRALGDQVFDELADLVIGPPHDDRPVYGGHFFGDPGGHPANFNGRMEEAVFFALVGRGAFERGETYPTDGG